MVKKLGFTGTSSFLRAALLSAGFFSCIGASFYAAAASPRALQAMPPNTSEQSYDVYQLDQLKAQQSTQSTEIGVDSTKIEDLERRQRQADLLKVGERITRLETIAETEHQLLIAICVGLAGLLAEAFNRMLGKARIIGGGKSTG